MRVVLDTNADVSALIWAGTPFKLLDAAIEGDVTLHTSPALLAELREVMGRPHLASRLGRQGSSIERALALYSQLARSVVPSFVPRIVAGDPDDDHVVAAAVAAKADLIVSGDRHLLALGTHGAILILPPAETLRIIAPRYPAAP